MGLDLEKIKAVEEASGHSVFGSSSLPRIIDCPASVGEELKAGLRPSSIYAEKGTMLHGVTEAALRVDFPEEFVHAKPLDVEDSVYVLNAVNYVQSIIAKHPRQNTVVTMAMDSKGTYDMVEVRSLINTDHTVVLLEAGGNLQSYGISEVYGTMDVCVLSLLRTDVIDHKFGHGVPVHAENNYQLVSYLGMAVPFRDNPDSAHELYVHINQPPLGIYEEWRVGWDVLYQMILGDITDAIQKAKSDNPPFGPSPKACKFCNAGMNCVARHSSLMKQASLISSMAKSPAVVSNDKWAKFLEASEAIKTAIKHVEDHAVMEIQKGNDFGNFKLISGRSNRKFMDDESAQKYMEKRLGKKAFKPASFISLAQAEKIDTSLKTDDKWNGMIHKPPGKPKLVLKSAKGEALVYGVSGIMNQIAAGEV